MKPILLAAALAAALTGAAAPALGQTDPALQARIERLEARDAIERLIVEYGRAIDERDFDAYVGLFAPDGAWIGGMGAFEGQGEIRGMLEQYFQPGPPERLTSFHLISNIMIDLGEDGETATAVSRWSFFTAGENGEPNMLMSGRYLDDLVRVDGAWRFARRVAYGDIPFDDPLAGDE